MLIDRELISDKKYRLDPSSTFQNNLMLNESSLLFRSEHLGSFAKKSILLKDISKTAGPFHRSTSSLSIELARTRRSRNNQNPLHLSQIANLLSLAFFDTNSDGQRPYPAAGGIYSISTYLVAQTVEGLNSGVHYVRWDTRTLEQMGTSDQVNKFIHSSIQQQDKETIPALILLVLDTRLSAMKYQDRAWRFGMLEAGCLLQTIYLAAEKLELAACALGGISDRSALRLCGIVPSDTVMFASAISIGSRK